VGNGGQVPVVGFFHHDMPVPHGDDEVVVAAVKKNELGKVVLGFAKPANVLGLPVASAKLLADSSPLQGDPLPAEQNLTVEVHVVNDAEQPAVTLSQFPHRTTEL